MSGILRLESLTKGNTLKQGDKTPLKYRLFDADGEKLNIAGKSAQVRLVYPDFLTIGYEKDGLTVAQDDTVTFTIDSVIPSRVYHVEIIVDDKFIFPSRADESKFTVDKSSLGTETNIIEIVGVDAVVRKAVDLINEDPNLIIDEDKLVSDIISNTGIGSIEEYHQQFNDVITELSEEKDYHSLPEIAGARGGFDTLGERLNHETFSMSRMGQDVKEAMTGGSVAVVGDDSILTTNLTNRAVKNSKIDSGAVTPRTTTFIKESTNLYNKETVIEGKRLDGSGAVIIDNNWMYSERIPVLPGQKYYVKYIGMFLWMNQDGSANRLGEVYDTGTGKTVTIPDNIYYIIPIVRTNHSANDVQISLGGTAVPFEPYQNKLNDVTVSYADLISNLTVDEYSALQEKSGGRNLLLDSESRNISSSEKPFYFWNFASSYFSELLVEGDTYTLSFDLKADTPTTSDGIFLNGVGPLINKTFYFPTDWQRQYLTFDYNGLSVVSGTQIRPTLYPNGGGVFHVRNIKLEKGDIHTPWRIAPEEYVEVPQTEVDDYMNEVLARKLEQLEQIEQTSGLEAYLTTENEEWK